MIGIMSNTEQEQVKIYDAYYNKGYNKGRADYEAECERIFEDNPPMHFNREQIMWIKEHAKSRYEQGRADAIEEYNKKIDYLKNCYVDACNMCTRMECDVCAISNFIEDLEQLKEQK